MSTETWVIEYAGGLPPCWILDSKGNASVFDVTFQLKLAQRFVSREDALHEMLRLGLSGSWKASQLVGLIL